MNITEFGTLVAQKRKQKCLTQTQLCNLINASLPANERIKRQTLVALENRILRRNWSEVKVGVVCQVLEIEPIKLGSPNPESVAITTQWDGLEVMPLIQKISNRNPSSITLRQFIKLLEAEQLLMEAGVPEFLETL